MKKLFRCLLVITLILSIVGCAIWTRIEKTETVSGPDNAYSVELPEGWVRASIVQDRILITRDGPRIQFIEIVNLAHDKAFPTLKKTSTGDMLPTEIAELYVAELKSQEGMGGLTVMENNPADIGGHPGFRLNLRFKTVRGLEYGRSVHGYADTSGVYLLSYQAPMLRYFNQGVTTFEQTVKTFKPSAALPAPTVQAR